MLKNDLSVIVIQRIWQGLGGFVTALLIALCLSRAEQGWYYTFISLAALYSFFEMGLSNILVKHSASMFIELEWLRHGDVKGDKSSEFLSFFSRSLVVYLILMTLFFIVSFFIGYLVFSNKSDEIISLSVWLFPWITLILMTTLNTLSFPFLAVIEGSGKIQEIYQLRLIQGILGSVATWITLLMGGWLWASAMIPFISFVIVCIWLVFFRKKLFVAAFNFTEKKYGHCNGVQG